MWILLFLLVTFKTSTKISQFFAYSFLKVHLHNSSKIKSHKEVTKTVEIKFFLHSLLVNWESVQIIMDPDADPGGPKTYSSGSGCGSRS